MLDRHAGLDLAEDGTPVRLHWGPIDFHVTDLPTPLEQAIAERLTHPPVANGWRFQGTTADGASLVFDVLRTRDAWWIANTYD